MMHRLFVLLFALLAACGVLHAMERSMELEAIQLAREAGELLDKGNDLAATDLEKAKEDWRKAAARLERMSGELGIANGPLFYNLGNAYFRLGDIGHAILAYRRAALFTPNDRNLLANLANARRKCQDSIQEQQRTRMLKSLFFWHYSLPLGIRERMFWAFFLLFFLLASVRIFWKKAWLQRVTILSFLVSFVVAFSMGITEWERYRHCSGVILDEKVTGRKGNSQSYEPSFTEPLHAGTEFVLLERRGNWLEIALADGRTCWIPGNNAGLVE